MWKIQFVDDKLLSIQFVKRMNWRLGMWKKWSLKKFWIDGVLVFLDIYIYMCVFIVHRYTKYEIIDVEKQKRGRSLK